MCFLSRASILTNVTIPIFNILDQFHEYTTQVGVLFCPILQESHTLNTAQLES